MFDEAEFLLELQFVFSFTILSFLPYVTELSLYCSNLIMLFAWRLLGSVFVRIQSHDIEQHVGSDCIKYYIICSWLWFAQEQVRIINTRNQKGRLCYKFLGKVLYTISLSPCSSLELLHRSQSGHLSDPSSPLRLQICFSKGMNTLHIDSLGLLLRDLSIGSGLM